MSWAGSRRVPTAARACVAAHQEAVGGLVERFVAQHTLRARQRISDPPFAFVAFGKLEAEGRELLAQQRAVRLRPGLVPVLGQQVTGKEADRCFESLGCAGTPRPRDCGFECVDVDLARGCQRHELLADGDRLRSERPAGDVHGLVQVVRGPARLVFGPQQVDHLAAVQRASRGERQQLDERARLPQPPGALRNQLAVDRGRETAEEPDLDAHRSDSTTLQRRGKGGGKHRRGRCGG